MPDLTLTDHLSPYSPHSWIQLQQVNGVRDLHGSVLMRYRGYIKPKQVVQWTSHLGRWHTAGQLRDTFLPDRAVLVSDCGCSYGVHGRTNPCSPPAYLQVEEAPTQEIRTAQHGLACSCRNFWCLGRSSLEVFFKGGFGTFNRSVKRYVILCDGDQPVPASLCKAAPGMMCMVFFIVLCTAVLEPFDCVSHPNFASTMKTATDVLCNFRRNMRCEVGVFAQQVYLLISWKLVAQKDQRRTNYL